MNACRIVLVSGLLCYASTGVSSVSVPPAAEFHKVVATTPEAEVHGFALGSDDSAGWLEATPTEIRKKAFLFDKPTSLTAKAVRFAGREAKVVTVWERQAKLLKPVTGKVVVGKGGFSFAYTDEELRATTVAVGSSGGEWKHVAKIDGVVPKAEAKVQKIGVLVAELNDAKLRRVYHLYRESQDQVVVAADVELQVGDATFRVALRLPVALDAATDRALGGLLRGEGSKAEVLRTTDAFGLIWPSPDARAVFVSLPKLERAALATLLTDIQDSLRRLGEPSPEHKIRDLESLLQRIEIAGVLAQVPTIKSAFTGEDAPALGLARDALVKTADAYGGGVLRVPVTAAGAKWVVYYTAARRTARVLPDSVTWTVTSAEQAWEVARPDKLSVFYMEACGATEPTGPERDKVFQKALAEALETPSLPPVHFAYGPLGSVKGELENSDENVSSLKVMSADIRATGRLALRLMVERQERDYLRSVMLEKTGVPLRLSWEGKAFALDRLKGSIELPGRVLLDPKTQVKVITPEKEKLEVLVIAGPSVWSGREGDKPEVTVRYQRQSKTLTFRKGVNEPQQATFDVVFGDNGSKPILRVQYRIGGKGEWADAEAPVVVIP